jgi:5-methylcytosine-specific restriction enzyme A
VNFSSEVSPLSRRVPTPHWESPKGHCRWCGKPVLHADGKKAGAINLRRHWHDACLADYKVAAWPKEARKALSKRDKGRCCDCGEVAKKWLARRRRPRKKVGVIAGPYTEIRRKRAFEVDHEVPLWSIAHLPDGDRVRYFMLDNLRTRCPTCHKAKTLREGTARKAIKAALKRKTVPPTPNSSWPGLSLPSIAPPRQS